MSIPNYTSKDWERIGVTPAGGILSRLKIHTGWLVRETASGGGIALCHIPEFPSMPKFCFQSWDAPPVREEVIPAPVVTAVTTSEWPPMPKTSPSRSKPNE